MPCNGGHIAVKSTPDSGSAGLRPCSLIGPDTPTEPIGPIVRPQQDSSSMIGIKKKSKKKTATRAKTGAGKTKTPPQPPQSPDDDLYETGDIAAPERDRDDEQRDL